MSDKQVVLAIFKDEGAADAAVQSLKDWDKADEDIKLNAVGVLVLDDKGKVKTHKLGKRSVGKGAGIGLVLAIIAPPPLLVGVIGGGVLGALHHKGLGIKAEERGSHRKRTVRRQGGCGGSRGRCRGVGHFGEARRARRDAPGSHCQRGRRGRSRRSRSRSRSRRSCRTLRRLTGGSGGEEQPGSAPRHLSSGDQERAELLGRLAVGPDGADRLVLAPRCRRQEGSGPACPSVVLSWSGVQRGKNRWSEA